MLILWVWYESIITLLLDIAQISFVYQGGCRFSSKSKVVCKVLTNNYELWYPTSTITWLVSIILTYLKRKWKNFSVDFSETTNIMEYCTLHILLWNCYYLCHIWQKIKRHDHFQRFSHFDFMGTSLLRILAIDEPKASKNEQLLGVLPDNWIMKQHKLTN